MERKAGEGDEELIKRMEKRIIELVVFGVFAVDGDQSEVDRQIGNLRTQIARLWRKEGFKNDEKEY